MKRTASSILALKVNDEVLTDAKDKIEQSFSRSEKYTLQRHQ